MLLSSYTELIKQLPYRQQAFETSRETWKKYRKHELFNSFCEEIFITGEAIFSRSDLFSNAKADTKKAIFSIILWGYPRNMRGKSFNSILVNIDELANVLSSKKEITNAEFQIIRRQLSGKGIGLSTLTKFLYFFDIKMDGLRCLILDSRIVSVLKQEKFRELQLPKPITEFNKGNLYSGYLYLMNVLAHKHGYTVDQLELFLFLFGNNLKENYQRCKIAN